MSIEKVDAFINNTDLVRVTNMKRIHEVQYMTCWNSKARIKKLDKDRYMNVDTGEIKQFKHSETRKDNLNSLRQTFKRLSYQVNANFTGAKNELWITMTYAENMTDHKQASKDFDNFLKRFRRYCEKEYGKTFGHFEYIKAVEPQERGAWHFHLLVKFPFLKKIYIANDVYADLWGHGIVQVKRPEKTDNMGAYFTSYLTNLELNETELEALSPEEEEKRVSELLSVPGARGIEYTKSDVSKRVIKGGRLHLYPASMQLYNKSRGIKMPERKDMTRKKAMKKYKLKAQNLTLRKSLLIKDEEANFETVLIIEQYNLNAWKENSVLALREMYAEELARCYEEGAETWRIAYFTNELDKIENKYKRLQAIEENKQAQTA